MAVSSATPDIERVFVVSPIYNDQCYGSYACSLLELQHALSQTGRQFVFRFMKNNSLISRARNLLCHAFLQDELATHLLFVDADIAFDAADVLRMLSYDHDVMAALYPTKDVNWSRVAEAARSCPNLPAEILPLIAGKFETFKPLQAEIRMPIDEPFPIASTGMGLTLIRRSVFHRMIDAYPSLLCKAPNGGANYLNGVESVPGLFNEMTSPDGFLLGEDFSFCERWRAIGGKVHGCAWFNIRHLGTYEYASDIRSIAQLNLAI
ncbi:hypothetical protein [Paraburkholderia sp. J76]|uniref:hypothetical protein n=1 Tax=Paraburkholderia sp. J76 TaxID=2805439 RepID=UPI002ABD1FE0|nr:hypothetical protein [Paraburkholderia sp. J76]